MDLAIYWLPVVGGILLGTIAAGEWYSGNRALAVWFGFAGVILFLFVFALQLQQIVSKNEPPPTVANDPNRPWLGVDHIDLQPLQVGSSLRATVFFINTGRSAALNARVYVASSTVPRGGLPPPPMTIMPAAQARAAVIVPNVPMRVVAFDDPQFDLRLQGDVDAIKSGALTPWIVARVEYTDSTGAAYYTMFRATLDLGVGNYVVAPGGNDAK